MKAPSFTQNNLGITTQVIIPAITPPITVDNPSLIACSHLMCLKTSFIHPTITPPFTLYCAAGIKLYVTILAAWSVVKLLMSV